MRIGVERHQAGTARLDLLLESGQIEQPQGGVERFRQHLVAAQDGRAFVAVGDGSFQGKGFRHAGVLVRINSAAIVAGTVRAFPRQGG